ncbi:MAG TPA: hypothetical protein VGG73_02765 [Vicinamibacterales bacterium]|jgi:hypothetical protein
MPTLTRLLSCSLVVLLMTAAPGFAGQQHVVSPSELASTVAGLAAAQDADRAAIREALTQPQVRDVVSSLGVSVDRVEGVANTLDGAELAKAGDAARQVNEQLVGGASSITLSTTTIIIVLLLLIILIVALK